MRARAASALPGPTTSSRAPGTASSTAGLASVRTGRPLRGSSMRPRKTIVGRPGAPVHRGSRVTEAKAEVSTPLGMTTASPPMWVVTVRRASSETAMRPWIFSNEGRSKG